MAEKYDNLRNEIDSDEGLKSKRKLLTVVSLILLAIQFSGAKVEEANTFILKLSFSHQGGIAFLLMLAVLFLLIRYYNYARLYHEKLFELWSSRMLEDPFFYSYDPNEPDASGLIIELARKHLKVDVDNVIRSDHEDCIWKYDHRWCFSRYIVYLFHNEYELEGVDINLLNKAGFLTYLKILRYELIYQVSGFFTHRENLDILTPYLLGLVAVFSYFFNEQVQYLLKAFIPN